MRNLLEETLEALENGGKTTDDVVWVGGEGVWFNWETFAQAANAQYDPGYGSAAVPMTLVVVGADWWLERWEYDGSEGWEFKTVPTRPPEGERLNVVHHLVGAYWPDLRTLVLDKDDDFHNPRGASR